MSESAEVRAQATDKTQRQRHRLRGLWENGWAVLRAHWYLQKANYIGTRVRLWAVLSYVIAER